MSESEDKKVPIEASEDKSVEETTKTEVATEVKAAETSKRAAEEPPKEKKDKKKKRRRNYDDVPPAEDEKSSEEEEEDDVDDDKLVVEDDEEDDLQEIDTENIITTGRRTRGKVVDYAKVAEELQKEGNVDEDDDDDEFKEVEKK